MSNYTPISIIKYFPFQLFGTELSEITSMNNPIPLAIRKLMQQIEQNGQYFSLLLNFLKFSEGLYVTSGASSWDHSEPYKRGILYGAYFHGTRGIPTFVVGSKGVCGLICLSIQC